MIDIDKVKAAFATTAAFCQQTFYKKDAEDKPAALCALSSLVSAAGVHPDLIGKFASTNYRALTTFFGPVLEVEYGVPPHLMRSVASAFDRETNEFRGIEAVLRLFENFNKTEAERQKAQVDMLSNMTMTWTTFPAFSGSGWFGNNVSFQIIDDTPLEYVNITKVIEGDVLNSLGYKVPKDEKKLITGLIAPQIIETAPTDTDFASYAATQSKQLIGDVKEWTVTV